ncbi:hypothetical protein [Rhodococcus sp. 1R11]|nr:hypothetical protein [Rhodococcus sp. 1R11]
MKIRSRRSGDMESCVTALATVHEVDGRRAVERRYVPAPGR